MATQSTSVSVLLPMRSPSPAHSKSTSTLVSRRPLSFSVSNILGLEDDRSLCQDSSNSVPNEPLKCFVKSSSLHSHITIPSEKLSKNCRPRRTFSYQEVWAMERVFRRSPYLRGKDEMDLVQRLGIPAKNLKFWFKNRRVKQKREREKRDKPGVSQTSLSNRLQCPAGPVQYHPYPSASEVALIRIERVWSAAETDPKDKPRLHAPVAEGLHYPNINSDQFRRALTYPNDKPHAKLQMETGNYSPGQSSPLRVQSFGLPMFHPDQLRYGEAQTARKRRHSRVQCNNSLP